MHAVEMRPEVVVVVVVRGEKLAGARFCFLTIDHDHDVADHRLRAPFSTIGNRHTLLLSSYDIERG